jgi:membrane glycosyltransferase
MIRLVASTLVETAIWTLLAPAMMLYYTQFVVMNLAGLQIPWTAQNRSDTGLGFFESLRIFAFRRSWDSSPRPFWVSGPQRSSGC